MIAIQITQKVCPTCGKKFETHKTNKKFCSTICCKRAHLMPSIEKTCPVCKTVFSTSRERQIFCSINCQIKSNTKHLQIPQEKTCEECGKKFTSPHFRKRFCSDACEVNNSKKRRQKLRNARPVHTCLWCRSEFHGVKHQIFCSYDCGIEFRRKERQIFSLNLSPDRQDAEFSTLRQQGKDYVLPEREIFA